MRKLVYALIRRRIRTLYPEPFFKTMARTRSVQAISATVVMYLGLFILMTRIEIEPTRSVNLYQQIIQARILPPTEVERVEDLPVVTVSEDTEETAPDPGDGVYTANTEPGIEQVDSGHADGPTEEDPSADTANIRPPGEEEASSEGAPDKIPKNVLRKLKIVPGTKPEPSAKPKPPPERFLERNLIAEATGPVEDLIEESVDEPVEPEPEPVEEPVVSTLADPVDEPEVNGENEQPIQSGRTNIIPSYIIDRLPRIVELATVEFPEEYKETAIEHTVLIHLYLDATGKIVNLEVGERAEFAFLDAAISALNDPATVIEPAYVGDLAVPSRATVRFNFESRYEEAAE